jgi:MFS family permease
VTAAQTKVRSASSSVYLLMPKPQRSPSLMRISTVLYLSSAAGLLLSGYLTDRFSWRLIFLPNLLYAVGAVCFLLRYYPTITPPSVTAERRLRLREGRFCRVHLRASQILRRARVVQITRLLSNSPNLAIDTLQTCAWPDGRVLRIS